MEKERYYIIRHTMQNCNMQECYAYETNKDKKGSLELLREEEQARGNDWYIAMYTGSEIDRITEPEGTGSIGLYIRTRYEALKTARFYGTSNHNKV
jgi:hypothetical protein